MDSKDKKCRHNWSEIEEEALLSVLEELVAEGYKGENGTFKSGTHEEVLSGMKNCILEIDLNIKQIINKMKRWSVKLSEVVDMMNTSGFGWDDTKKCVIVDNKQVLAEYMEKYPKIDNHANKEFKEFERLQGIFGKDRATGRAAETPVDAVREMKDDGLDNLEEDTAQSPGSFSNVSRPSSAASSYKHKMVEYAAEFISAFEKSINDVRSDFATLAGKIADPPREDIVEELETLRLTENEELDVLIQMVSNPQYEKFFWRLQGQQRMSFVRRLIGRN